MVCRTWRAQRATRWRPLGPTFLERQQPRIKRVTPCLATTARPVSVIVDVHVPEPGDQKLSLAVDDLCASRNVQLLRRANRCDTALLHHNSHVWLRRRAGGIDHGHALNCERLGLGQWTQKN